MRGSSRSRSSAAPRSRPIPRTSRSPSSRSMRSAKTAGSSPPSPPSSRSPQAIAYSISSPSSMSGERRRRRLVLRGLNRQAEIELHSRRDDAVGVNRRMATIIMIADMIHPHGVGDARELVNPPRMRVEVRIIGDALQVAFEMRDVDRIEAHERRKEADIGLGERVFDEVALSV